MLKALSFNFLKARPFQSVSFEYQPARPLQRGGGGRLPRAARREVLSHAVRPRAEGVHTFLRRRVLRKGPAAARNHQLRGRDVQPALIGRHYIAEHDSAPVQYDGIV